MLGLPKSVKVAAILALIAGLAVTGVVFVSSNRGKTGSLTVGSGCSSDFSISTDAALPHGPTPAEALADFLRSGSVHGLAPPIESPASAGYPASGWHEVRRGSGTVVYQSGSATLNVAVVANGWQVDSGEICGRGGRS